MHFSHHDINDQQRRWLRAVLLASGVFFAGVLVVGLLRTNMLAGLTAGLLLIIGFLLYETVLRHVGLMVVVMRLRFAHYRGVAEPQAGHEASNLSEAEHAVFDGIVSRLQMDPGVR